MSDRGGRPRLTRYSRAAESGPEPPSAFGISPRKAGGELLRAFSVSAAQPFGGALDDLAGCAGSLFKGLGGHEDREVQVI